MLRIIKAAVVLLTIGLFAPAAADDNGTRDEAIAMVKRVEDAFKQEGPDATFSAITSQDPRFKLNDLYPFVYDSTGLSIAHGANAKMVGKMWINTKDQDGKYLIQEMLKAVHDSGDGWIYYKWPHPISHKIMDKSAFVKRLDDRYFVGVGIYSP